MTLSASSNLILRLTRSAFGFYFLFAFWVAIEGTRFKLNNPAVIWVLYLLTIYILAERIYDFFLQSDIDLTFAFPLLFATYLLNLTTILLGGQEAYPLFNRTEHFASFILIAFIVWTFFLKYLPQEVWQEHPYYTAFLVLGITSFLGVGNEIFELFFDHFFATQLVGREDDTSLDLLMNTLGASLFLSVRLILGHAYPSYFSYARKPSP